VDLGCCAAVCALLLTAKVAGAADEDCGLVVEDLFAGLGVLCDGAVNHEAGGALVDDFDELGDRDELGFGGDGELADLEELLAVEKHAGIEVGDDVVEVEGRFGVEGRNNTECGDDLEVLITLVDEGKVASLCANTEV
jgi:hypothetical protein